MAKLIYIGGYGHSGTTLLEYLLTGCSDLIAFGEVASATRANAPSQKCTCGWSAVDCSFWSFIADPHRAPKQWTHEALDAKLLERACETHAGIIDSSKTAWRRASVPFRQSGGSEFQLLHVVRDPRAVCWSMLEKARRTETDNNALGLSLKTTLGWLYANFACELFRRRIPVNTRAFATRTWPPIRTQ
ncbi:MAG: hypothetical protein A49_03500 [Methyloceanibacter sp.]|nr:MAG: hypothetical protein A49_03500 [Methyloceanibacter sp.]